MWILKGKEDDESFIHLFEGFYLPMSVNYVLKIIVVYFEGILAFLK